MTYKEKELFFLESVKSELVYSEGNPITASRLRQRHWNKFSTKEINYWLGKSVKKGLLKKAKGLCNSYYTVPEEKFYEWLKEVQA